MAQATFSLAVENLDNLLNLKADQLRGAQKKAIRFVRDELHRIDTLLDGLRQSNDRRSSECILLLRDMAQEAENFMETFDGGIQATPTPKRRRSWVPLPGCVTGSSTSDTDTYDPVREKRSVRNRVREIARILGDSSGTRERQHVITSHHVPNNEVVLGLDREMTLVVEGAILAEETGLSVAAIVGLGGVGKTTLARMVYNNPAVAIHFGTRRAWIHVSRPLNLEEIIRTVVMQIVGPEEQQQIVAAMNALQLQGLVLLLHQRLNGRRYFIVLDDVADDQHRTALAQLFPDQGNGSRLLITSCNRDITNHAHYFHEMKIMDPNRSWALLLQTAFFQHNNLRNCPEHLEHIGREILRSCHGLPSAIKAVGRLLVAKQSAREWEDVLQTMDRNVMSDMFDSNYHRLSPELKLCFLCLAFFRQGGTIRAEKLVQVLTAGGMIRQDENMEEDAKNYLDQLICSYMVQVEDLTKDNRVKSCRIFDVFQKPSLRRAEHEINLEVQIMRKDGRSSSRAIRKPRHRAIYCSRAEFTHPISQNGFLRSVFFHGGGTYDATPAYWESFQFLWVLDLEGFGLEEFPEAITALTRLKYLGLRGNHIRELPESLERLEELRVLDISLNFAVVVPDVLWKMKNLRHLYMSEIVCRDGLKIDSLVNIRTLAYIPVDSWKYERSSLQMMTSLRKLGIEELNKDSDVRNLFAYLDRLPNLVCLNLRGRSRFSYMPSLNEVGYLSNLTELKIDGRVAELPGAENFPPKLCYLTLANTCVEEDPMPVLERLGELLYLKLRNAYSGEKMVITRQGFRKLRKLRIGELWHLRQVQVEGGAMTQLRSVEIHRRTCPNWVNLPTDATIID